jgi:transcriptional regulator EpsA
MDGDDSPWKPPMQAGEEQITAQRRPEETPEDHRTDSPEEQHRHDAGAEAPSAQAEEAGAGAMLLDSLELEALVLNLDASLNVHARHQFFTWTQGLLQSLIKHELLICALRNGEPMSFYVDSFSTFATEPSLFSEVFRQDTSLVPHLIKAWEDNHYRPVLCDTGSGTFAGSPLARELNRVGASSVAAHGTYDASGKLASFFVFACQPGTIGPRQAHLVELVVPFVHAAWLRTQIDRPVESSAAKQGGVGLLTQREQEILKWIYLGKSNIEIGAILEISPLTVKNHVQKILRKLNVQNRTQAVGKGLALRILST